MSVREALFQYPEGFWPDGDKATEAVTKATEVATKFQYPEGFWPDGDSGVLESACRSSSVRFSTPKGFGPMVTPAAGLWPKFTNRPWCFSTPKEGRTLGM